MIATDVSEPPPLPARPRDGHKGTFGKVLFVAGSRGMSGAAVLCGRAALRGGAGLVQVACPAEVQPVVAGAYPGYTTFGIRQHADGTFWIPMRGFSQSLNISAAASACVTRARLGRPGDLNDSEISALRERFQRLSVKQHRRLYK